MSGLSTLLVHLILLLGAGSVLLPFLWMVSTSFKDPSKIYTFPPELIPDPFVLTNYTRGWSGLGIDFRLAFLNTLTIVSVSVIGMLCSASIVAYSFARLKAPGRDGLFMILLATMMLPGQVTMIPTFVLFSKLRWVGTFKPLIVPYYLGGRAFNIFLMHQFFRTIPTELDDAARIDGCSTFGIYWRIFIPLSKPVIASVSIFHFMWRWNDFMGPLIYINAREKWPLALALQTLRGQHYTDIGALMAMSLITLIPCILVFFFAQRYFIAGVTMTGLKR